MSSYIARREARRQGNSKNRELIPVTVQLPPSLRKWLKSEAQYSGAGVSGVVVDLISAAMEETGPEVQPEGQEPEDEDV